ncbi:CBS domain-containing protein [Gammaproteobacteria bacterium]|nr:CBS domain-containing protein [Gammaproteobacteria bacterium]
MHEDDKNSLPKKTWLEQLSKLLIREPKNREQLMEVLRDSEERNILSSEILSMIESVLQVSEMQVRDVMIPKSQMVVAEQKINLEKLLPLVIESGHSRFPIVDNINEDVIGILLAKDLLAHCFNKQNSNFKLQDILRPATFVPQSKRLDILLREFRINRNHMAIVIDEYGHVAGLVTIENVLEQIVGDIEDEYDISEDDEIKKHSDGHYVTKATVSIDNFNEYFSTKLGNKEFDTIGGLVSQNFGHLPKRGESIIIENLIFKVLHSDNRRIHLLDVIKR